LVDIVTYLISLEPTHGQINIHRNYEFAFRCVCGSGSVELAKCLIGLEPTHGPINIHIYEEEAFRVACKSGSVELVKYLISLEPTHGQIDIHADEDVAFATGSHMPRMIRYLIRLEPTHGKIDIHTGEDFAMGNACSHNSMASVRMLLALEETRGKIDIRPWARDAFRKAKFPVQHMLIKKYPEYPWSRFKNEYNRYRDGVLRHANMMTQLHKHLMNFETEILELNVLGIICGYLV
jgi:hypothetical protein